jgi:hypothetical protein
LCPMAPWVAWTVYRARLAPRLEPWRTHLGRSPSFGRWSVLRWGRTSRCRWARLSPLLIPAPIISDSSPYQKPESGEGRRQPRPESGSVKALDAVTARLIVPAAGIIITHVAFPLWVGLPMLVSKLLTARNVPAHEHPLLCQKPGSLPLAGLKLVHPDDVETVQANPEATLDPVDPRRTVKHPSDPWRAIGTPCLPI